MLQHGDTICLLLLPSCKLIVYSDLQLSTVLYLCLSSLQILQQTAGNTYSLQLYSRIASQSQHLATNDEWVQQQGLLLFATIQCDS